MERVLGRRKVGEWNLTPLDHKTFEHLLREKVFKGEKMERGLLKTPKTLKPEKLTGFKSFKVREEGAPHEEEVGKGKFKTLKCQTLNMLRFVCFKVLRGEEGERRSLKPECFEPQPLLRL